MGVGVGAGVPMGSWKDEVSNAGVGFDWQKGEAFPARECC